MKVGAIAESVLEYVALRFNLAPTPLVDTQVAFNGARAIMAGAKLGVFEALAAGPRSSEEVAHECRTSPRPTKQLLDCLVGLGYLTFSFGRYANGAVARKWIVKSSPVSVHDKLVFQLTEWNWMAKLEDFVRTGEAIDIHGTMTAPEWAQYQDGMRALAAGAAPEVAKKLPMPKGATRMLDIGGSHGLYSTALCDLHPGLESTILELPAAIVRAAENLAKQGNRRVTHRAGDALSTDLGEEAFDFIFISNLVHHFTVEQNCALAARCFRALRPGGVLAIGEYVRSSTPGSGGAVGATADLYFAFTSTSGTWSESEIASWERDAGFEPGKPISFIAMPGFICQPATKPRKPRRA
jgi:2-polyprenyl-3-methyl-5-hydroxy-6-metoxy-1,4-benzoquinol methylase